MKKYIFALILILFPTTIANASSLLIGTITPNATVPAGTALSFQIMPSDGGIPAYTLSDSFPGSTLSNSNITTTGLFKWTPSQLDMGTHVITITATDSSGFRSSLTQTLVISAASPFSIQNLSPGPSIFPDNDVSFIAIAQGYNNPFFSISDSYSGSSISSSNISSAGNFGWTPKLNDVGVHNLTIRINDSNGRTAIAYQTITVNGIKIQNVSSYNIAVGNSLFFTISPYGLSAPSYRISDSLRNNTIDSATLSGNDFKWSPQVQDIGTHIISVRSTDASGNISATQITINVISGVITNTPIAQPAIAVTPTPQTTATSETAVVFKSTLGIGSSGIEVKALQNILIKLHLLNGTATGYYGALTKKAVMAYQKAHGLSQLGNVGPSTRSQLNKK